MQGPRVKLLSAIGHKMDDVEGPDTVTQVAVLPTEEMQHCGGEEGRGGAEEQEKDGVDPDGRSTPSVTEQGNNSDDPRSVILQVCVSLVTDCE